MSKGCIVKRVGFIKDTKLIIVNIVSSVLKDMITIVDFLANALVGEIISYFVCSLPYLFLMELDQWGVLSIQSINRWPDD